MVSIRIVVIKSSSENLYFCFYTTILKQVARKIMLNWSNVYLEPNLPKLKNPGQQFLCLELSSLNSGHGYTKNELWINKLFFSFFSENHFSPNITLCLFFRSNSLRLNMYYLCTLNDFFKTRVWCCLISSNSNVVNVSNCTN